MRYAAPGEAATTPEVPLIELIVIDLCVAVLAPEVSIKLYISQANKDGIKVYCYGDLGRQAVRRALRVHGVMQEFDGLLYSETMSEMTSTELRLLADPNKTLWVRTPDALDYNTVLSVIGPRKRALPRALRLLGQPSCSVD